LAGGTEENKDKPYSEQPMAQPSLERYCRATFSVTPEEYSASNFTVKESSTLSRLGLLLRLSSALLFLLVADM
jgi:hypothetical protein